MGGHLEAEHQEGQPHQPADDGPARAVRLPRQPREPHGRVLQVLRRGPGRRHVREAGGAPADVVSNQQKQVYKKIVVCRKLCVSGVV